jgi:RNA polymerase sigma factor (TIGR02999 family)
VNKDGTDFFQRVVSESNGRERMNDATAILNEMGNGSPGAAEKLLELVYEELRRMAASKMAHEAPGNTLQTTALVHEAWLRLVGAENRRFENRRHFFGAAAESMRRILIDRARRRRAERHGGAYERVHWQEDMMASPEGDEQLLALHDALQKLELKHPIQARVVALRYFTGMSNDEIAALLGVSLSTVKNYWLFSRAWLFREIKAA